MKIDDTLHHNCGIAGIYEKKMENIPEKLFYSLFSLQHRGQESAGIAYKKNDKLVVYKDLGMVSRVLSRYLHMERKSNIGIGHVRYSTHGGNKIENAQPMLATCSKGAIALAHNGNLTNALKIKNELVAEGSIFQSDSDTELILHLIARSKKPDFYSALKESLGKLKGAYSIVMIHNNSLIAIRDPDGYRPLYMGQKGGTTLFASESCAMDILRITEYRSVEPGEIIYINKNRYSSEIFLQSDKKSQCIFELIYFSRPDSIVFNESVHLMRKKMGAALAEDDANIGDIVVPVPDSGNSAAIGYAQSSGIPFDQGLTRNHYIGRSFIMPTSAQREFAVRMKLHPVHSVIKNKKIILVDDSLVRGTTSKILVKLLKEAGAKEIHLRLSSPEIKYPCHFGIDIPTKKELISNSMNAEEIAKHIGADSVKFLSLKKLKECVTSPENYCSSCFSGIYPKNNEK